ncbi:MAG: HD domain-containing protein [Proteobacteria bacterium]|nr:HD domain-containing protein [Pseudomonadota bacterium]
MLDKAIQCAVKAHAGQKDKAGAPYILHPLRIMMKMDSQAGMIAAMLHDVVEDSSVTLSDLRAEGFSEEVIAAVDHLTRREGEAYEIFINRLRHNPLAVKVKLADLEDNMDIRRIENVTERDIERIQKYQAAWGKLSAP